MTKSEEAIGALSTQKRVKCVDCHIEKFPRFLNARGACDIGCGGQATNKPVSPFAENEIEHLFKQCRKVLADLRIAEPYYDGGMVDFVENTLSVLAGKTPRFPAGTVPNQNAHSDVNAVQGRTIFNLKKENVKLRNDAREAVIIAVDADASKLKLQAELAEIRKKHASEMALAEMKAQAEINAALAKVEKLEKESHVLKELRKNAESGRFTPDKRVAELANQVAVLSNVIADLKRDAPPKPSAVQVTMHEQQSNALKRVLDLVAERKRWEIPGKPGRMTCAECNTVAMSKSVWESHYGVCSACRSEKT